MVSYILKIPKLKWVSCVDPDRGCFATDTKRGPDGPREKALGRIYNHTEETKIKLREIKLGKTHSEETKAKLKIIQSNRAIQPVKGKSIRIEDTLTGQINIFYSLRQAGKELSSNHTSMRNNLDKGKLYRNRYLITSVE